MNRNEIEVRLIELSQETRSKKEDAAKSVAAVKESIRKEQEKLQGKMGELTAIRDQAVRNIRENFDVVIEQARQEHEREIARLSEILREEKSRYSRTEEEYLDKKKELLKLMCAPENDI